MKAVLAFDAFKGSLPAPDACRAAMEGIRRVSPSAEIVTCPLSDGGEGFADCMRLAGHGRAQALTVTGPLGEPVEAEIVWLEDGETAVIEAALACGLGLVPEAQRSPGQTTTYGLGEMIAAAVDAGARALVIGLGGTATNDAGLGMLAALGWTARDAAGAPLPPVGASLAAVRTLDGGRRFPEVQIIAACDVTNPLYGPQGAAHVYAPQKGASPAEVRELDRGLAHFASVCAGIFGTDIAANPGAGAAGGLGFALQRFLGASFRPGAEVAIALSRLREQLSGADFCLTGEGRTDAQTAYGKLPAAVGACCRETGVPCVCLSGSLGPGWRELYAGGLTAIFSISQGPSTLAEAIANTAVHLADAAEAVVRCHKSAGHGRK